LHPNAPVLLLSQAMVRARSQLLVPLARGALPEKRRTRIPPPPSGCKKATTNRRITMQVGETMSKGVRLVSPEDSIQKAASVMRDHDCGALPVRKDDRLVGIITDRDIAVRAVAEGKPVSECKVGEVMTPGIKYVFEDELAEAAAENMSRLQVRRLPVLNREKRLVGIVALADLAVRHGGQAAGNALKRISRPA